MIVSYFTVNFMSLMILLAIIALMLVNRDAKIPAASLFILCVAVLFALTVVRTFDLGTPVDGLAASEAARIVQTRVVMSTIGYVLRPCVILVELIIILNKNRYRLLCVIPAIMNAVVYSTALFGSGMAFYIDEYNQWHGGPFSMTIYITMLLYLLILLYCTMQSFRSGDRRKSIMLVVIFIQAVFVALHERVYGGEVSYTNEVMALCVLEYYIYLTNVYRQELNDKLDRYVDEVEKAGARLKTLTVEIMESLASAIDAKDKYTRGHSARVAEYSRKIAEMAGKSEQECEEIYYAALLHDVGKIGISDNIITKVGKLTKDEYEEIKRHPVLGTQILQRISEFPFLSLGAGGHHERYDGKGYPNGLKGTDIPDWARIISVADAYDAMTSRRSYRDPIPQQIVREELVKGAGTQFDPEYARLMLHLIDVDTEYEMSEREEVVGLDEKNELIVEEYRSSVSTGVLITTCMTTIRMRADSLNKCPDRQPVMSLVLFDSLDGRVHTREKEIKDLNYFEYGEIWFDGQAISNGARDIRTEMSDTGLEDLKDDGEYIIEAVKKKDHMQIKITGLKQTLTAIIALPDSTRFTYIGLTGEYCRISRVSIDKAEDEIPDDYIPRIAEEISYINVPAGDMPNVQIDGYRTDASDGVEITDGLQISFHGCSLPTARLVWHCPFIDIFTSDDGKVGGPGYRDLAFARFDGESWQCDEKCSLDMNVRTTKEFKGWDAWKNYISDGFDAIVRFEREGAAVTIITENEGISIRNTVTTDIPDGKIYAAITGDQVAITNIRVQR